MITTRQEQSNRGQNPAYDPSRPIAPPTCDAPVTVADILTKMTFACRAIVAACLAGALGCAGGVADNPGSFGGFEEGGESTATAATGGASMPEETAGDSEPSTPPDLGSCVDDGDCMVDPAGCYENGVCNGGVCETPTKFAGDPCDDDDACTGPDVCDGAGNCLGQPMPCEAPNAAGGSCVDGLCMDLECLDGFGNCNGDWIDGCEMPVGDDANCGECGMPCEAGAHATAVCNAGTCEQQCEAPWSNCDGDWSNGCEIPAGVANQCDVDGLNPNGCWTPYCGQSDDPEARNFGTWFCLECSTCHVPAPGTCQWCDHATGHWYPMDTCNGCGNFEDLACGA